MAPLLKPRMGRRKASPLRLRSGQALPPQSPRAVAWDLRLPIADWRLTGRGRRRGARRPRLQGRPCGLVTPRSGGAIRGGVRLVRNLPRTSASLLSVPSRCSPCLRGETLWGFAIAECRLPIDSSSCQLSAISYQRRRGAGTPRLQERTVLAHSVASVPLLPLCEILSSRGAKAASSRRSRAPASVHGQRGGSPLQARRFPACNRLQLRRREAGWRAAGGERPVRRMTNSIRPCVLGEPATEWRSLAPLPTRRWESRRAEG